MVKYHKKNIPTSFCDKNAIVSDVIMSIPRGTALLDKYFKNLNEMVYEFLVVTQEDSLL